ncbi:MAG: hypothetical protein AVDCRST_MAG26-2609 [uncultured Chloroflexia bacterium]|uniref:Uncharacterized protein n=1 Tax=uncultured Chloroflexia bacterium TaxID=1672391 RepID=A0A6J4J4H7_9CHLR|nr:MAG: hypothetical protein AVDCRST_MAG26-2609 [uncultured Chloroflexia bacterium]
MVRYIDFSYDKRRATGVQRRRHCLPRLSTVFPLMRAA